MYSAAEGSSFHDADEPVYIKDYCRDCHAFLLLQNRHEVLNLVSKLRR